MTDLAAVRTDGSREIANRILGMRAALSETGERWAPGVLSILLTWAMSLDSNAIIPVTAFVRYTDWDLDGFTGWDKSAGKLPRIDGCLKASTAMETLAQMRECGALPAPASV